MAYVYSGGDRGRHYDRVSDYLFRRFEFYRDTGERRQRTMELFPKLRLAFLPVCLRFLERIAGRFRIFDHFDDFADGFGFFPGIFAVFHDETTAIRVQSSAVYSVRFAERSRRRHVEFYFRLRRRSSFQAVGDIRMGTDTVAE